MSELAGGGSSARRRSPSLGSGWLSGPERQPRCSSGCTPRYTTASC